MNKRASQPRVGEQRPGGRAQRVRDAVLTATTELLASVDYVDLAYEDIARRAGVHKTTIYRRWPDKPELVADAVGLFAEEQIPIPDTGHLQDDLVALSRAVAVGIASDANRRRSKSLVAAAAASSELGIALAGFMSRRITESEVIVDRAIERGEIPESTNARLVIESVVGSLWFRLLLTQEPLDDDVARDVALTVAGRL